MPIIPITGPRARNKRCSDPTYNATPTIRTIDNVGNAGNDNSLVPNSAGNPRISYSDEDDYSVRLLICDDPGCGASSSHIVFAHGFEN